MRHNLGNYIYFHYFIQQTVSYIFNGVFLNSLFRRLVSHQLNRSTINSVNTVKIIPQNLKFIIEKIKDLNGNFDKIVKTQTFHPDCFCREKMVWEEDFYVGGSLTYNVA